MPLARNQGPKYKTNDGDKVIVYLIYSQLQSYILSQICDSSTRNRLSIRWRKRWSCLFSIIPLKSFNNRLFSWVAASLSQTGTTGNARPAGPRVRAGTRVFMHEPRVIATGIPTRSLPPPPSISALRRGGSRAPPRVSALGSKIHRLQLRPSLLRDLKLPALSAADTRAGARLPALIRARSRAY